MTPGKGKAGLQGWVGFEGQRKGGQQTQPQWGSWKDHRSDREGRGWHCYLFFIGTYLNIPEGTETMSIVTYCQQGFCSASENSLGIANGKCDSLLPFKLQYLVWETENRSISSRAWKKENVIYDLVTGGLSN